MFVPIYFCPLLCYTCTYTNVALYVTINRKSREKVNGLSDPDEFVIDVLLLVYNKTWENQVILSSHNQVVLDIQPRLVFDSSTLCPFSQHLGQISSATWSWLNEWPFNMHIFPSLEKGGYVFGTLVCLSVCLFVCGQHYSTSYEWVGMKFYGGVLVSTMNNIKCWS